MLKYSALLTYIFFCDFGQPRFRTSVGLQKVGKYKGLNLHYNNVTLKIEQEI